MIERTPDYDTPLSESLKNRDLIDIGDMVDVYTLGDYFKGIVKYKPCATGDSWIFEEIDSPYIKPNGKITFVQNFIRITKNPVVDKKDVPF